MGADPRVRALGRRAGRRQQAADAPAAARRLPAHTHRRRGPGRGVLVVLLRIGRAGPIAVSQGRQLHRRDGVPVRLHQPGDRARDHPRGPDRLAVHRRRVRRRPDHDRADGAAVPPLPQAPDGRGGAPQRRPRRARAHGGARRDGHERHRRRVDLAPAALPEGASQRSATTSSWTGALSGWTSSGAC